MNRRCLHCMKEFGIPEGQENNHFACPYCGYEEGTPPKEITYLYPGMILQNRYVIGTTLGAGGFGIIYKAWDMTLDIVVAIKEYYPAGLVQRVPGNTNLIVYDGRHREEFYSGLERFLEEARKMALFSNSKNIVHVENHFEANNTAYIVMEYLDGISVKKYLNQEGGRLDLESSLGIILAVADALQEIHDASILHRDVSPDNVFLCGGNRIKLLDFGAARLSNMEKEVTRSIILKPGFAPPEQYQSKSKQGPWTDIYALSAMLYRCLTGVMPDESTDRINEDLVVPPKDLDPSIPEYISNTIMKGMSLNTELRFKNIREFKKALLNEKKVLDEKTEVKMRKRKRLITISVVVAVLFVGGVIAWKIYDSRNPILDPATVTVWVAYSEDENADMTKEMIEEMSEVFLNDQDSVTISVEAVPEKEYKEKLAKAKSEGKMPTVYETKYASDEIQKSAASVKSVYESIDDLSNYYFLEKYKRKLIKEKEVPFGFNVPVIYVRRSDNIDAASYVMNDYDDIKNDSYYITPEYLVMELNSLGGKFYYDKGFIMDESSKEMLQNFVKHTKVVSNEDALQGFVDGNIVYYLASVRELQTFNKNVVGLYEMRPINTGSLCGEFTDSYSINGDAKKNEIAAAQVWMRYMLEEGPQKTYHLEYKHSIPLQKNAYTIYIDNNSKLEIVNDYLDNLVFYPENTIGMQKLQKDLWEQVVIKKAQNIDGWYQKQK